MRNWSFVPALFASAVVAGGCEPQVDVKAKADGVRLALLPAVTREMFLQVATQNELVCHAIDSKLVCTWHEPDRFSLESLIPCGVIHGAVTTDATSVDGRRHGDYVVEDTIPAVEPRTRAGT